MSNLARNTRARNMLFVMMTLVSAAHAAAGEGADGAPGHQGTWRDGLDADPRSEPPPRPSTIEELERRFLPNHEPVGDLHSAPIRRDERVEFTRRVASGACYAAVAFAPEAQQVDIDVFEGDRRIAQDLRRDPWPVATFCASGTGHVTIRVTGVRGSGQVQSRLLVDPQSRAHALGPAADPLHNRLLAVQRRTMPRSTGSSPVLEHHFDSAGSTTVVLPVPSRGCHAVVAAGEPGADHLTMRVRRRSVQNLGEDRRALAEAVVGFCAEAAGFIEVDLMLLRGSGAVQVQLVTPIDEPPE
ncbi:MAG: hypothetical protein EA398_00785 [Deltaproteobacteria bacterium]|nr:MAG: hypothetical protein EA398_00785 [Deltaproteobacteria bacterium]